MHTQNTTNSPKTNMIFVSTMFDETMNLLLDAQEYFSQYGPHDQKGATPVEKLVYSAEMSRITLRLSSVMAWLLARRAEFSGQISREEAIRQFRLAFNEVCMRDMPEMYHVLPNYMCQLMERSLDLYRRAHRLDDLLATDTLH